MGKHHAYGALTQFICRKGRDDAVIVASALPQTAAVACIGERRN